MDEAAPCRDARRDSLSTPVYRLEHTDYLRAPLLSSCFTTGLTILSLPGTLWM